MTCCDCPHDMYPINCRCECHDLAALALEDEDRQIAERQRQANLRSIADGGWVLYPSEY